MLQALAGHGAVIVVDDVLPVCQRLGMGVLTRSPLARGFLSGQYRKGPEVDRGGRRHRLLAPPARGRVRRRPLASRSAA